MFEYRTRLPGPPLYSADPDPTKSPAPIDPPAFGRSHERESDETGVHVGIIPMAIICI